MDNLETPFDTRVGKARGNTSGAIVERLIKLRASKTFGHSAYSLDEQRPPIVISGPHEHFSTVIGKKHFSDGCCIPIRLNKVWRDIVLRNHRVEQISILQQ